MAKQVINIETLDNGMTLVAETMKEVSSAAFMFLVPAGAAYDPAGLTGTSNVLAELLFRGAGELNNRALNERLDSLGLHRQSSVASLHSYFGGALVADNLWSALEVHADILRRPMLEQEQFELCRQLALQSLESIEDDPRHKISLLVHEQYLPYPFGRPPVGKREELELLPGATVQKYWQDRFTPANTILAVAGKVDFKRLKDFAKKHFGDWQGAKLSGLTPGPPQTRVFHQPYEGAQVHVGIMYPSVTYDHEEYYAALAAVGVLSGGMSGRLFTEVREKRGLCYAVGAAHQVAARYGTVQCYLGSTPDRAQEALDVTLTELTKLAEGITQAELDRAKVGLRASLIMQGESTSARALSGARDLYHLERVRTLTEIEEGIQTLTVKEVVNHVQKFKPADFTVATIGPKELRVHREE
jgi:predicted Zn-dependent peptidase